MTLLDECRQEVAEAANKLDELYPDWYTLVDLDHFDMTRSRPYPPDNCGCIAWYLTARTHTDNYGLMFVRLARECGVHPVIFADYTTWWTQEIELRRNA